MANPVPAKKPILKEVPEAVRDDRGNLYKRGRFLGKGGFARCYELVDTRTNTVLAGKIVSKSLLVKQYQKDKMAQEITIHRGLNHAHIVRLHGFFEDSDNVYVLLELCPRRSLMELHKRRGAISEPEARYLTHQVADGVEYLHRARVIHRDLKLGNIFLNEDMQVKLGDFGLATTVEHDGERKKTLCGTPNYIAPEVLEKKGHSYEVDNLNNDAVKLIRDLLAAEPTRRPKISQVKSYEFFRNGYMPVRLPTSCLTMAPKFDSHVAEMSMRRVPSPSKALSARQIVRDEIMQSPGRPLHSVPENSAVPTQMRQIELPHDNLHTPEYYTKSLYQQLVAVTKSKNDRAMCATEDEAEAPECLPVFWISKWVDYSDKYGIGYQLCDNSVGVLFNDASKLVLDAAGVNMQYVDKESREEYYTFTQFPNLLDKKVTLLKYFRTYMNEHLIMAGEKFAKAGDELARLPCLLAWFRTKSAIVLHLANGTLQINFFIDHTKIILCPLLGSVTYIDEKKEFRTYKLSLLQSKGCGAELRKRLLYAEGMVERLMSKSFSKIYKSATSSMLPSMSNLRVASQPQEL
ncbi:unnamed protein product, partial [Mesorhabditis belari]|uniref:Serine/threonine-protein kinase PLK n=1 Tax=Mesorhabditis belari TaxID=2138241 RepID=A0AAF3EWZ2_9BILA